jgi:hypothetical protein
MVEPLKKCWIGASRFRKPVSVSIAECGDSRDSPLRGANSQTLALVFYVGIRPAAFGLARGPFRVYVSRLPPRP